MAFLSFSGIVVSERPAITTLIQTVAGPSDQPLTLPLPLLLKVLGIPLFSAIAAYLVAAQAIRLVRLVLYMRALHSQSHAYLRAHAPLHTTGIDPRIVRFDVTGQPARDHEESLARLIAGAHHLLVLGEQGSGKTVAVYHAAALLSRRRAVAAVFFGRAPLPVLVPLGAYDAVDTSVSDGGESPNRLLAYLTQQLRVCGSAGLAARLPYLLQRRRVFLLLDGLDAVPAAQRLVLCHDLAHVQNEARQVVNCLVTCQTQTYLMETRSLGPLDQFQRVALSGLTEADAQQTLRSVKSPASVIRPARNALTSTMVSHHLEASLSLPATLAALRAVWASHQDLPTGRGQLYHAAVQVECERACTPSLPTQTIGDTLGALASALHAAGQPGVYIPPRTAIGKAVAEWLAQNQPLLPTDRTDVPVDVLAPATIEGVCAAALLSGILYLAPDRRWLAFRNQVMEAAFASSWLRRMDAEHARLTPELLQSNWLVPLLLWAGASPSPTALATRVLHLSATPDVTSVRARLVSKEDVIPMTLAAALAISIEGFASSVAAARADQMDREQLLASAEHLLRTLLDQAALYMERPDQQDRLATALQQTEREAGPELVANLTYLIGQTGFSRLVRAQLITTLGLLASPAALAALMVLLVEPDAVLRQAVNQAIVLAGSAALTPLNTALNHASERVRIRASEALSLLGAAAVDTAIATLKSAEPQQRAGAAHTLGLLRAGAAVEPLTAALDDSSGIVRIAAAHALGATATPAALAALEQRVVSPDVDLRVAIAQALGASRDPGALPTLVQMLDDAESSVRAATATSLGALSDDRGTHALLEHRDDADALVQNAILSALRRLGRG